MNARDQRNVDCHYDRAVGRLQAWVAVLSFEDGRAKRDADSSHGGRR